MILNAYALLDAFVTLLRSAFALLVIGRAKNGRSILR